MNLSNLQTYTLLIYGDRISRSSQNGVRANKGLGPGTQAGEVLARGQAVVSRKVGEESLDVAREARDLGRGDEAEDVRVAVVSVVELPGHAADSGGRDGAAGRRDGACAAQRGQPDHHLVLGRSAC